MKRNKSQLSQELRQGSSEAGRQLSELRWSGPARRHPPKASEVVGLLLLGALIAVLNDAYGSAGEPPGSVAGPRGSADGGRSAHPNYRRRNEK